MIPTDSIHDVESMSLEYSNGIECIIIHTLKNEFYEMISELEHMQNYHSLLEMKEVHAKYEYEKGDIWRAMNQLEEEMMYKGHTIEIMCRDIIRINGMLIDKKAIEDKEGIIL